MQKRIEWLDVVRGIAIFLVILGHSLGGIISSEKLNEFNYLHIIKNFIYSFHMPLFFIISGLFLKKWLNFNFKKAILYKFNILKVYFLWTIILGLVMALFSGYTNNGLGLESILMSPIHPENQYWYLYILFFNLILLWMLNKYLKYKYYILIFACIFYFLQNYLIDIWELSRMGKYFIFLCTGYYFNNYLLNSKNISINIKMFLVLSACFATGYNTYLFTYNKTSNLSYLLSSILMSCSIFILVQQLKNRQYKIIQFLGKQSLVFYVVHLIPLAGTRIFMLKVLHIHNLLLVTIIITFFGITISAITYLLSKKFNIYKYLF